MKKNILLFLIVLSCYKVYAQQPSTFIFKKSFKSTPAGVELMTSKIDSLIDDSYNPMGQDSSTNSALKRIDIKSSLKPPDTELVVQVEGDSIWRFQRQEGKMLGDFQLVFKGNGALKLYDKSKTINYKTGTLFNDQGEINIQRFRNDLRTIMGFTAYKMVITIPSDHEFGATIYEMYVTDVLNLPMHSVIFLPVLIEKTFPLHIAISEEKLPGLSQVIELVMLD